MAHLGQPRNTLIYLNYFIITILVSLFVCEFVASDGTITVCPPTNGTNNQPAGPTYRTNLQTLLSNFATSATTHGYRNSTAGESPDKVYGHYLCRGDATSQLCRSCVTNLTNWVSENIEKACVEGFGFMDQCMLHYANYSFFGTSDDKTLAVTEGGVITVEEFNRTLISMVDELVEDAAFESDGLFVTREASFGAEGEKVYGLAQCTPDIGRQNCSRCLKTASSRLPRCCGDRKSIWFMVSSCQLRYSVVSFYDIVASPPSPSPSPANSIAHSFSSGTFALASWALFVLNLLLCCFVLLLINGLLCDCQTGRML